MRPSMTAFVGVVVFVSVVATTMNRADAGCMDGDTGGPCVMRGKQGRLECISGRFTCRVEPTGNPRPYVSRPDAAFQFAPCLDRLDPTIEKKVVQALQGSASAADVRGQCKDGKEQIGIWLGGTAGVDDDAARQRGLNGVSILAGSETFGVFLDANAMRKKAAQIWGKTPHNMDHDGNASSGPIHLTSYDIQFGGPPNLVVTSIKGYDDSPWPDVYFTLRSTDTLSLKDGSIQCQSNVALDAETSPLHALTGVFVVLLPLPLGGVFAVESAIVAGAEAPGSADDASVACPAARLIPKEIMIPGKQKAVISYSRLVVNGNGITAGGGFSITGRKPSVVISGPSTTKVEVDQQSKQASFTVITTDLLPRLTTPRLTTSWSSPSGTVLNDTETSADVTWPLNNLHIGQLLHRSVNVTVTDSEGLSASTTRAVTLKVVTDAQLPAICSKKPDLPQCK